jgi:pimeloyl-ACP methyl ester carboxylesterase
MAMCLQRLKLSLPIAEGGPNRSVKVTTWGSPLETARCSLFYFGGTPSSAEETPLHSIAMGKSDMYKERGVYLVCIDKPGVGGTDFEPRFRLRRDWPRLVAAVADSLGVQSYGVFGMSNGGPYVMAALTAPGLKERVLAAAMVVGVSDVSASGYFSCRHPSGWLEGCSNSLPTCVMGPCICCGLGCMSFWCFDSPCAVWRCSTDEPLRSHPDAAPLVKQMLRDGAANLGRGAALDCQLSLSPLHARPRESVAGGEASAADAYRGIQQPVALWYGTSDSTVPMFSADWLAALLPAATKHYRSAGHSLIVISERSSDKRGVGYADEIVDDLLEKMGVA